MNSAETHVDIFNSVNLMNEKEYEDRLVTFLSESGAMEFFIISNSKTNGGPKYISYKMSLITGFS